MLRSTKLSLDVTPVAIAAIAVLGIVAVSFSPLTAEAQTLAIGILGSLGGGATGVAMPRGSWGRGQMSPPPPPSQIQSW